MSYVVRREASKRGKGPRWYAVYTVNGRKRWELAGSSRKAAESLMRLREQEVAAGTFKEKQHRNGGVTFQEYSETFLKGVSDRCKESTVDDYRVCLDHLLPILGKKKLSEITRADCKSAIETASVRKEGKAKGQRYSASMVNKMIMVLKLMLKEACEDEHIETNPAQYIKRVRGEHQEMDFLRPDEVSKLLQACETDFYPIVAVAVMTGMREGEEVALRRGDVDLDNGVIYIRRNFSPKFGITSTKTHRSTRAVEMSQALATIVRGHLESTEGEPDDLLFPGKDGGCILPQNMIRDTFEPTLKRAGLRKVRWHDLRHTFAALMLSSGENVMFVSRQLGHSSVKTTLDIYGHVLPEVSASAGRRLDDLLFNGNIVSLERKAR
ncbi:MAG: site-specific integrase [Actinobacteria bacterium]|nr:site-specific integrase [Actinomycetota bacterium]MBU1942923.1 site-specific integrase [Actinomycetota bacterium]MBU2687654.1 site-specific integrase [Actinomycetota bacterium]